MTDLPKYTSEYLASTKEDIDTMLENYGVAIVPNVLSETECKHLEDGMWTMLEQLTSPFDKPIKRDDATSWKSLVKLYPMHSMLIQHWKVGHSQPVWDVRQNPNVIQTFANLWNVEPNQLLTSFDGISFHMAPEKINRGWFRNNWLHTDQSYTRPNKECIQGWVTARDVNDGDGTLTFLKGSHKLHANVAHKFDITDKADWMKLSPEITDYYVNEMNCPQECIKCPKGSLVLWDSRTIHCGREPTRGRSQENTRCVVYVCMTPRQLATKAGLKKRIKAFEVGRMTTHWPHKPKLFGVYPRTYGGPLPEVNNIPIPSLTQAGRALVGYDHT